jgi:AraC family transcriptional regulator
MKPKTEAVERDYRERILRVLVHIQQNLDAAISLDELARIARFSPFHFHRVFRGMVGESVMQHVRRLRLERAAMRLRQSTRPITDIAFEAGYEAHESFTRAFHASFGCSPSEYRRSRADDHAISSPASVHYVAATADMNFNPIGTEHDPMNVEIRELEPMRVAFVRHTGPYDEVGTSWERLCDWAGANFVFGPETRLFGACYDDPDVTPPDRIRYDACMTVDDALQPEGDVGVQTIPGGTYAVVLHEGPYQKLSETYAALFGRWFADQDIEPGDPPCLEFYLNDPNETEPEDLLTEVCVRIER